MPFGLLGIHYVSEETLKTIAAVVGAIATSLAVIIALYRETIREWRKRPKLELEFHPKEVGPLVAEVNVQGGRTAPSYWLRILVSNGRRRRTAAEVSVLLTSAHRLEGTTNIWARLDTVGLIWSNRPEATTTIDIPPGVGMFVDLFALRWPSHSVPVEGSGGCWVEVQVSPTPSAERNRWEAGRYLLELAVTAKDTPARRYSVELDFDGIWAAETDQWAHYMLRELKEIG